MALWRRSQLAAHVSVPKASMNKNYSFPTCQDNIRSTCKLLRVQTIAEPFTVKARTHSELRASILAPNLSHECAARFWRKSIHLQPKRPRRIMSRRRHTPWTMTSKMLHDEDGLPVGSVDHSAIRFMGIERSSRQRRVSTDVTMPSVRSAPAWYTTNVAVGPRHKRKVVEICCGLRSEGLTRGRDLGYAPGPAMPAAVTSQRNGMGANTVLTEDDPIRIEVPGDRDGRFEPLLTPKHERRFMGFDEKIVAMCARDLPDFFGPFQSWRTASVASVEQYSCLNPSGVSYCRLECGLMAL